MLAWQLVGKGAAVEVLDEVVGLVLEPHGHLQGLGPGDAGHPLVFCDVALQRIPESSSEPLSNPCCTPLLLQALSTDAADVKAVCLQHITDSLAALIWDIQDWRTAQPKTVP